MSSKEAIQAYFSDRPHLSMAALGEEFSVPTDLFAEFSQALRVFEEEYGITAGSLRADDSLDTFVAGVNESLSAAINHLDLSDSLSELNYRLKKRRKVLGKPLDAAPTTIGEYVIAWLHRDYRYSA